MTHVGRSVAAVASVLVLATSSLGYAAISTFTGSVKHVETASTRQPQPIEPSRPLNILLVGNDDRTGLSRKERANLHVGQKDYGAHTEPIMVAHVSADGDRVTVVSLPRDSLVTIPKTTDPKTGAVVPAHQAKINSAYGEGGPDLTIRTVEQATGLKINHYAEVGLGGFVNLVDKLGGVPMCLTQPLQDADAGLNLAAGTHQLSGRDALALVRARHIDNDLARIGRQQQLLRAMGEQALYSGALLNPLKANSILQAVGESIKTDSGLGADQMKSLLVKLRGINPSSITFLTVPITEADLRVDGQGSTVMWDGQRASALFSSMAQDTVYAKPKAITSPIPANSITVSVVNAAGIKGLGTRVTAELRRNGFYVPNGPSLEELPTPPAITEVVFNPEVAEAAKVVAASIVGAKLKADPQAFGITVRAGTDYRGSSPVRQPSSGASQEPSLEEISQTASKVTSAAGGATGC